MRELTPLDFERFCAALLERSGYGRTRVTRKGPKGGDGGIDLEVWNYAGKVESLVQCKRYRKRPASGLMHIIRELTGAMSEKRVARGILMITTDSTWQEQEKAKQNGIELIDEDHLVRLATSSSGVATALGISPRAIFVCAGVLLTAVFAVHAFVFAVQALNALHDIAVTAAKEHNKVFGQILLGVTLAFGLLFGKEERPKRRRYRRRRPRSSW